MSSIVAALLLGAFAWTFLEYVVHRWLGHDARTRPNPFASEHVRHHGQGDYFAPAWKKGLAALLATAVLSGPAIGIAGTPAGPAWVLGFVGMYLTYEVLHRRQHTHPGFGPYGRWARRHHFHHHFVDTKVNHGVTIPLWDRVFGTYRSPGVIRVPARLQMPWLADPQTGRVRPEHAAHFELVG